MKFLEFDDNNGQQAGAEMCEAQDQLVQLGKLGLPGQLGLLRSRLNSAETEAEALLGLAELGNIQ